MWNGFRGPRQNSCDLYGLAKRALDKPMRFRNQCVLLALLFCLAAFPSARAQQKHERSSKTHHAIPDAAPAPVPPPDGQSDARPLTLDEGLAIISAALDSRHHASFKTDCSHFVHGLYERAGFHYAYAPSADLYAGIDGFERVTAPQPGDLAVWRGHAGIVVNPAQHSFFSLLRSGVGVASYDSAYWKKKGRPRFFRYVRPVPDDELSDSHWTASR
jgi:cell wall-associated NlpC family hydrolase